MTGGRGSPSAWIEQLVDAGSFLPSYPTAAGSGDGDASYAFGPEIVAGLAKVGGRPIAVYAQDPSVGQGFVTSRGAIKIRRLMDRAVDLGIPVVALLSSPGVDVHEGLRSGEEYTSVISGNIALSGIVPQIGVVMSVTMGAPAYSCTLMDLTLFNKSRSHLVVTGPTVVERVLGEQTTLAELGGSDVHAKKTGIAHFVDRTPALQLERAKWLIGFLPSNRLEDPPRPPPSPPSAPLPEIPARAEEPFDIGDLIAGVVDASQWVEYAPSFGPAIVCAFAHVDGHAVGIVANQSLEGSGAIDARASQKAARFIRICDAYNVTVLTLIDVPGFMPGVHEETHGLLRHGAALCAAMQTGVPRISVVVRRCYGAAAFVMLQSRSQGGDLVLALESARIAVMGFDAGKHMVYGEAATNADEATLGELRQKYRRDYEDPRVAYTTGLIDEIVAPSAMRERLARHLGWLQRKRDGKPPARRHAILP